MNPPQSKNEKQKSLLLLGFRIVSSGVLWIVWIYLTHHAGEVPLEKSKTGALIVVIAWNYFFEVFFVDAQEQFRLREQVMEARQAAQTSAPHDTTVQNLDWKLAPGSREPIKVRSFTHPSGSVLKIKTRSLWRFYPKIIMVFGIVGFIYFVIYSALASTHSTGTMTLLIVPLITFFSIGLGWILDRSMFHGIVLDTQNKVIRIGRKQSIMLNDVHSLQMLHLRQEDGSDDLDYGFEGRRPNKFIYQLNLVLNNSDRVCLFTDTEPSAFQRDVNTVTQFLKLPVLGKIT